MRKYVYGPVPSRRLGRSLGVDLVPFKTCSYDCIYCQLGKTTHKTINRKEYAPLNTIIREINRKLKSGDVPDYITLAGSGEPTLYSKIGELIDKIKLKTKTPVAVITNGSLLWDPDVQEGLLQADLVVPSLDAGDADTFGYVNRPHRRIIFDKMVDGLIEFRNKYHNQLWLEVFLLGGITAIDAEVDKIAAIARKIAPDKIQLNTVERPPAENFAFPANKKQMTCFANKFGKNAGIITNFKHHSVSSVFSASDDDVLSLIRRRPCSLDDVVKGLGIPHNEALKHLDSLLKRRFVGMKRMNNRELYVLDIINNSKED